MWSLIVAQFLNFLLVLQIFFPFTMCKLQNDYIVNDTISVIDDSQSTHKISNISLRMIDVIHKLQPKNIIEVITSKNLNDSIKSEIDENVKCNAQFLLYKDGLKQFELWALKMMDSSSKIPSGLLNGNTKDLGVYDECISIKVDKGNQLIRGHHCMYSISIKELKSSITISSTLSICVPAVCSPQFITKLLQNLTDMMEYSGFKIGIENVQCSSIHPAPFEIGEIITIVIFSVILCFLFGCTIFDIFIKITSAVGPKNILNEFSRFSLYKNLLRIFDTTTSHNQVPSVHGIRVFRLAWVMLCHQYLVLWRGASCNLVDAYQICGRIGLLVALIGSLTVINENNYQSWNLCIGRYGQRGRKLMFLLNNEFGELSPKYGIILKIIQDVPNWSFSWNSIYIFMGPFVTDTFLVLNGVIGAYVFMKEIPNMRRFNPIVHCVRRWFRLTPSIAALVLLAIYILPRMGSGPMWNEKMNMQKETCKQNWWLMILWIQNYVNTDSQGCMSYFWYLEADMQLFWIAPVFLYPLAKKPKIGSIILAALIIASIMTPAVIAGVNNVSIMSISKSIGIARVLDMMKDNYITTYTRSGPWLLGAIVGYKLSRNKNPPNSMIMTFGWIVAVSSFSLVFFTYRIFQSENYEFNAPWEIFYAGFARHLWGFGICWMIYATSVGYGGVIGRFLSLSIFIPFGRVSYGSYLIHMVIQEMNVYSSRISSHFSDKEVIYALIGEFVVCNFAGLVLTLIFESPFLVIQEIMTERDNSIEKDTSEEFPQSSNGTIGVYMQTYSHNTEQHKNGNNESKFD